MMAGCRSRGDLPRLGQDDGEPSWGPKRLTLFDNVQHLTMDSGV